jgi:hypothetical protein
MGPPNFQSAHVSAPAAKAQALTVTRAELGFCIEALLETAPQWLALFVPGARYLVHPRVRTTMSIQQRRCSTSPTTIIVSPNA